MAHRTIIRPARFDKADTIEYRPSTPGDWSTIPRSVQQALDILVAAGGGGGSGDVSSDNNWTTDNAITRTDGTGNKKIQQSGVTLDDSHAIHMPTGGSAGLFSGTADDFHIYTLSDTGPTHIVHCGNQTLFTGTLMALNATTTRVASAGKLEFRDTGIVLSSSIADGQFDITADGKIVITSPIIDVDASTGLDLAGANLNSNWTINSTNELRVGATNSRIYAPSADNVTIECDDTLTLVGDTLTIVGAYGHCDFGEASGSVYSFRPKGDGEADLGTTARNWLNLFCDRVHLGMADYAAANPPSDGNLDAAFGAPATLVEGFVGILWGSSSSKSYICWVQDSDWYYIEGTKAT